MRAIALLAGLAACRPAPTDTAPTGDDTDVTDTDVPSGDSREDAVPVDDPSGATPMRDAIDPVGDVDWYAVDLDAGDFLRVQTVTVPGDPSSPDFACDGSYDDDPLDSVVTVYDPAGDEVVAADGWSAYACGPDSLGLVRADVAGTWTVEVEDWNNWSGGGQMFGNDPVGGPEYAYDLYTAVVAPATAGGALGDEPVLAALDAAGDDWTVHLDVPTHLQLSTAANTNAELDALAFELVDDAGDRLAYADADPFFGVVWGRGLRVPLAAGDYTLRVTGGDWVWLWTDRDEAAAAGDEVEPDDDAATATPFAMRAGTGVYAGDYTTADFAGWIADGDVDTFALDASAGDYVYVRVGDRNQGSSLTPTVTVVGPDGATVATGSEDGVGYTNVTGSKLTSAGTYTVTIAGKAGSTGYYLGGVELWDTRRPW